MTYKYVKEIQNEKLREIITDILDKYSKASLYEDAENIIDILLAWYEERMIYNGTKNTFTDIMISAAYLHNIFNGEKDSWLSIFKPREQFQKMFITSGDEETMKNSEHIFSIVEGQMGVHTPIPSCRPNADNPVNDFANAIWFNKYVKNKLNLKA